MISHLDPNVEWHPPRESMEPGTYRGHDGVRDYLGRLGEVFEERRLTPIEVIEVDDQRVIGVARIIGRSEKFGTEIDATWAWLITIPDQKATLVVSYLSKQEALEAAGLSE
jgi:ketosteroid isomerase-like protein